MNSVFPAIYSTLSPEAIALLVNEKYGLANLNCKLLVRGVGDTYLAESNENKWIIRVYRSTHRSIQQITEEVRLLTTLHASGVSVSYPIADQQGELIQTINAVEGHRFAVLFSYAKGESKKILNQSQLLNLGREMAKFHNISEKLDLGNSRWIFDLNTTITLPVQLLKPAMAGEPENYSWLLEVAAKIKAKLYSKTHLDFKEGYCHYDFLPKNFHFEEDKVTFFDFDFMGKGWLVNDVMTFWQHLVLDVYTGRMKKEAADEAYAIFLKGYQELRTLTEAELEAVPYLAIGFWLFYMGFHTTHDQFSTFAQPSHVRVYVGVMKNIVDNYWK